MSDTDVLPAFSLDFDPAALLTVESGGDDDFLSWLESSMLDRVPDEPGLAGTASAGPMQLSVDGPTRQAWGVGSSTASPGMPIKQEPFMGFQPASSGYAALPTQSIFQQTEQTAGFRTSNALQAASLGNGPQRNRSSQRPEGNMVQQQQQQPVMQGFSGQQHAQQLYNSQAWMPPFMQQFQLQQELVSQPQDSRPFVFQGLRGPPTGPPVPAPAPGSPEPPKKMGPARRFR